MSTKDIHEPYPVGRYTMSAAMKPFKKSQWEGAVSKMFVTTKTEKSGEYICPPTIPESGNTLMQKEGLDEALMALMRKIVKEKMYDESVAKGCPMEFY